MLLPLRILSLVREISVGFVWNMSLGWAWGLNFRNDIGSGTRMDPESQIFKWTQTTTSAPMISSHTDNRSIAFTTKRNLLESCTPVEGARKRDMGGPRWARGEHIWEPCWLPAPLRALLPASEPWTEFKHTVGNDCYWFTSMKRSRETWGATSSSRSALFCLSSLCSISKSSNFIVPETAGQCNSRGGTGPNGLTDWFIRSGIW